MKKQLLFVGLDVHARSITIALAEGSGGEARTYGSIANDLHALEKVFAKLRKAHPGAELRICYEAGPTGFVLARRLGQLEIDCTVVAPSMTPSRSGDRIKTDRRDALKLARLHRAGELTAVHLPDASDEAMRDLCRARTDAVQDLRRSRAQLKAFLLRNGYRYTGKSAWTEAHRRYLRELVLPHAAQRVVLEDAIAAIGSAEERIARLEEQMEALLPSWPMQPVVAALMALRGFGPLDPTAERPFGDAQITGHVGHGSSAAHQCHGVVLKLPVVAPAGSVVVHGCYCVHHSPARKIEVTSMRFRTASASVSTAADADSRMRLSNA
jgi:transposase